MGEWKETRLKEIIELNMGQSPKSEFYNNKMEGIPMLQGNRTFGRRYPTYDTYTTQITKIADPEDVIMSVRAPVGDLNIIKDKICIGRGVCSMKMKNGNQNFLYYFMEANIKKLLRKENGTVFSSVSKRDIENLEVLVPVDIKVQQQITSVLKSIDDKIELNNEINNNLEEQLFAIYNMFFIEKQNCSRKNCKAKDCFDISIGKTPPRKESQWFSTNEEDIKWISISDMGKCGLFINRTSERLTQEAINKFNIVIVPADTVILSFKLTVGRIAITTEPMVTNEAIAHFKTTNPYITEYLYCYLKSINYKTLGSTSSIATAVNSKIIRNIDFILPTEEELTKFHNITKPMFDKIKKILIENSKLIQLRDILLPRLMSGEIDVSNIKI